MKKNVLYYGLGGALLVVLVASAFVFSSGSGKNLSGNLVGVVKLNNPVVNNPINAVNSVSFPPGGISVSAIMNSVVSPSLSDELSFVTILNSQDGSDIQKDLGSSSHAYFYFNGIQINKSNVIHIIPASTAINVSSGSDAWNYSVADKALYYDVSPVLIPGNGMGLNTARANAQNVQIKICNTSETQCVTSQVQSQFSGAIAIW